MPYVDPAWALAGVLKAWGLAAVACALVGLAIRALWLVLFGDERRSRGQPRAS